MKIAVVILHFGELQITKACVQSLQKNETYPCDIIVVNNMSTKYSTIDFSKKKIVVINNKKNLGFAGGVNTGIRYALQKKYDAIFLLNNDTSIAKPVLGMLSRQFANEKTGIVGPAIRFSKKSQTLYDLGGKINMLTLKTSHTEVTKIKNKKINSVAYISGCAMFIRKEVFKKIGYFDEHFFLYYEDADFCLRARRAGFSIVVDPSVAIDHLLSKSVGKMSNLAIQYLLQSGIIFGKKYSKNLLQKIANKFFLLYQALSFFKANTYAGITIIKTLLASYV